MNQQQQIKELYRDLIEINAYYSLQNKPFWFNNQLIIPTSEESEDAYYEMDQQYILEYLDELQNNDYLPKHKYHKAKVNHYDRKMYSKNKVTTIHNARARKFNKKYSNKTVRKTGDFHSAGNMYRKIVDISYLQRYKIN